MGYLTITLKISQFLLTFPIAICFLAVLILLCFINSFIKNKKLRVKYQEHICYGVFNMVEIIFSPLFPHPIYIRYDRRILETNRMIVTSNHCTDYDWLFIMTLFHKWNRLSRLTLLIKKQLETVPLVGLYLRANRNIFLYRNNPEEDLKVIKKSCSELSKENKITILLFPEGTYPYEKADIKSKEFAKEHNLQFNGFPFTPRNILIPRTKGYCKIEQNFDYEYVADFTLFTNPYKYRVNEDLSLFKLIFTEKNIFSPLFNISLFDREEASKENFIMDRFMEKDEILEKYRNEFKSIHLKNVTEALALFKRLYSDESGMELDVIYIRSRYQMLFNLFVLLIYIMIFVSLTRK